MDTSHRAFMIGSLFAGVDESPDEPILYQGRSFKTCRGMGSLSGCRARSRVIFRGISFVLKATRPGL
jgi:IMP dehydrogenase/GMP reductase